MMKTSATLLMVVPFLAAGCSSPGSYWYHPGKTLEQAKADYYECRHEARREAVAAASDEYVSRTHIPSRSPGSYDSAREGSLLDDPLDSWSAWRGLYAQNVFAGRMKQKGYHQVKHYRLPPKTRTTKLSMGAVAGR
jgi:hypothetical protein